MPAKNPDPAGNTRTIARNSLWYGLELIFNLVVAFGTSVAVARVVGKDRLSYYQYVVWLTNITIAVGSFGLPITTRKYMAEHLNRGETVLARTIYWATIKLQGWIALAASAVSLALVLWLGDRDYLAPSVLLVAAMAPRILATIPSQANNAAEVMRRNTGPALIGGMVNTLLTILSLLRGWDLAGIAAAACVASFLECGLKLLSVERWLGGVARGIIPPELKRRMFVYSGQGLALMVLNIVVWDRSDMVILKALNPNRDQITFFSIAFNLVERILVLPYAFGGSLGATMMAQFGRAQARLNEMTVNGARYALLVSSPLLVGVACISQPLVLLLYREPYRPLIPVLVIVALMAVPKALVAGPSMLLQARERQGFLIFWGCICGAVDIGLDVLLTPRHGAIGAAIANGSAQALAALGTWIYVCKTQDLRLKLRDFGPILLSGAVMAVGVLAFTRFVPGYVGMFGSIALGAAIWTIALRVTGALNSEDASRFLSLGGPLPTALQPHWKRLISWLAPARADA